MLDIEWKDLKATKVSVLSVSKNTFRLKITEGMENITCNKEFFVENGILTVELEKNEKAEFTF